MEVNKTKLPKIFVLGYGALGKCFVEVLLKNLETIDLTVCDILPFPQDSRFKFIQKAITRESINTIFSYIGEGDILVDVSTNVDAYSIWTACMKNKVRYMNTAMEEWPDAEDPNSFPTNEEEMYNTSLGFRHEKCEKSKIWSPDKGTSSLFEHGMNPGLISHFVKKGLIEAARYFLKRKEWNDLNHDEIYKYLQEKNYSKLALSMGLHTIHCSETDNQYVLNPPKNLKEKFYNSWSCIGFLTEGMVPLQAAQGSHEDTESEELPRLKNNTLIMSKCPSRHYWAKSWVPLSDIEGCVIPHGESYSLRKFLLDKETGYTPSQYYVYDFNPYAKEFIRNLPKNAELKNTTPEWEVLHPMNHELRGYDKVGALLIFKNNRGWWCGSIMDEFDAAKHFDHKFGPTVLQVIGGVYAGFLWLLNNPYSGNKWSEQLDSELILKGAESFLGRIWSDFVDLNKTHIKDCYKFESFLTKKYED